MSEDSDESTEEAEIRIGPEDVEIVDDEYGVTARVAVGVQERISDNGDSESGSGDPA